VGPVFDLEKLKWMNGVYVRRLSVDELVSRLATHTPQLSQVDAELLSKVVPLVQERIKTLSEFWEVAGFFFENVELSNEQFEEVVVQKGRTVEETKQVLQKVWEVLELVDEKSWRADVLEEKLGQLMEKLGWSRRDFCMTIRGAVSGRKATPPLFEMLEVLGKEKVLSRLD
ncbi:glutamate--tRNA ligase, partial [Candidatus Parcubacteria bacterium]|nr:glutamate--tRNA ligase [Candidatus Parcubacteria bacterium]